jgi:hypothetical protein
MRDKAFVRCMVKQCYTVCYQVRTDFNSTMPVRCYFVSIRYLRRCSRKVVPKPQIVVKVYLQFGMVGMEVPYDRSLRLV